LIVAKQNLPKACGEVCEAINRDQRRKAVRRTSPLGSLPGGSEVVSCLPYLKKERGTEGKALRAKLSFQGPAKVRGKSQSGLWGQE